MLVISAHYELIINLSKVSRAHIRYCVLHYYNYLGYSKTNGLHLHFLFN